jgi:CheY-like chemotaxis protein
LPKYKPGASAMGQKRVFGKQNRIFRGSLNKKEGSMGKKILVVDDEPDLLKVTLVRLKKTEYEVYGGTDGWEALDIARQVIPDLIILDVYLPMMNGDEVTKILKKNDELKHIPVILITANAMALDERVKECGADGYLTKPFEPEELIGIVKKFLGNSMDLIL